VNARIVGRRPLPSALNAPRRLRELEALEAHPVAATATITPPARSAMLFSRFMPR